MDTGRCCNETTPVHICRRGDGSAIYAEGRGVSPSCPVGRSPRDRRPGGPRLSRSFGEAALMPLRLVRPARRAGRRLTGRAAILAAHHPPTYQPTNQRTNKPTNQPTNQLTNQLLASPRTANLTYQFHLVRTSGEGVFKDAEIVSPPVRQFQKTTCFS